MSAEINETPIIEAAKSGRSSCRICRNKIEKNSMRIGIPSPYSLPDGRIVSSYRYYHPECVPYDRIPAILNMLNSLSNLEEGIKDQIKEGLKNIQKISSRSINSQEQLIEKPFIEYSRSGRGSCRICNDKIDKGIFRIAESSKLELPDGRDIFGKKLYHINCFLESSDKPGSRFQDLIQTSLKRKSIKQEEVKSIEDEFEGILTIDKSTSEILELIGHTPVRLEFLKKNAQKKGISFEVVKKAIQQGLIQGKYFQPTQSTIQKLD